MSSVPEPQPEPLRFGPHLLEELTQRVLEWTREHHPERLLPPLHDEQDRS
jgi:hypothetical protein